MAIVVTLARGQAIDRFVGASVDDAAAEPSRPRASRRGERRAAPTVVRSPATAQRPFSQFQKAPPIAEPTGAPGRPAGDQVRARDLDDAWAAAGVDLKWLDRRRFQLTYTEGRTYAALLQYWLSRGVSPFQAELSDILGHSSPQGCKNALASLQRKGFVSIYRNAQRGAVPLILPPNVTLKTD